MGPLTIPEHGTAYMDANCFIYTVEHIEPYETQLTSVWQLVQSGQLQVITSELTLLEVMVKPLREQRRDLEDAYREVLERSPDVAMRSVSRGALERAAQLRASANLKTPDAIHAATALEHGCELFLTNDPTFRRATGLPVVLLGDLQVP